MSVATMSPVVDSICVQHRYLLSPSVYFLISFLSFQKYSPPSKIPNSQDEKSPVGNADKDKVLCLKTDGSVFVFVYLYLCVCIRVFVFVYLYLCICICVFLFGYLYLGIFIWVFVFGYLYLCVCICVFQKSLEANAETRTSNVFEDYHQWS